MAWSTKPTQVLRRALKLNTDLYGENDPSTVSCMIHLGAVIINQTKYAEAEDLLTKAIETDRRISPDGNKDFAYALNAIGELYVRKGEFEKAKPFLQESIAMSDKLFGEDNPDSAFALISLARAQAFSADAAGAEITYRRSIAIYRRLPARFEMRLAVALLNFGSLLSGKGNYDEGINVMREAEAIFLQKQGESFTTFEAKTYLCTAYITKSDFGQGMIEGTKAIEMGRKLNLEKTPDFINTQRFLGLALTRTGKAKEAEPILRQSLEASKIDLPNTVPLAKGALGECLTEQQKYAEARQLLSESYEDLNKSLGAEHPSTVLAKNRLETVDKKMNGRESKSR
ncbi:MAG: tetratricopeptide repeat protein [Chloracidobacterium sp.]|nr:tetratricopeptide repeat protein [Chloracidobacterium sp.]